jgi:hypothetical protein
VYGRSSPFRQPAEKTHDEIEQPDTNECTDARHYAANAAQTRANNARERALAPREAAEQATTAYARHAHHRVADLHGQLAVSHEDFARTLRLGGPGEA